jgi:uncharacterized protein (DUF2164 family)
MPKSGRLRASKLNKRFLEMGIELPKPARAEAIASIRRYFEENLNEPIGDLAAGLLLNYFLEEIGPAVYNQAIADAQARMQRHVADLSGDLFAEEFQFWAKAANRRKNTGKRPE